MAPDREPRTWIDVSAALTQRAGIARYVRGITEALVKLEPQALGTYSHSWTTPGAQPFGVAHAGSPASARAWRLRLMIGHLLHLTVLPGLDHFEKFHATDLAFPFAPRDRVVVTVHDLTAMTHPAMHSPLTRVFIRFMLAHLKTRQHRIIAVSHRTAHDLATHAGIEPSRITVIHPGVAEVFHQIPDTERTRTVLSKYGLSPAFVLAVGTLEPRKNLRRLIAAFEEIAKPSETLVIVGGKGWGSEAGLDVQYRNSSQIRVIGFVPDADLVCLYHACQVFVMPSLYEGFGSPIAEALACGANIICSSECGVVEVLPTSATVVNPLDTEGMAVAIRTRLDHPKNEYEARSRSQTWADAASATMAVLQN